MSEETTQNLPNNDLKLILARLDSMDARLEKLEAHSYDTKPIWETALKEIAETRVEMHRGFQEVRGEIQTGLRKVERKIDVLNVNILEVRAELREFDERVSKLESEPSH